MLSYLAIKNLLTSIKENVIFDALASNNPHLTTLLTELMTMGGKVESEANFTEQDLIKLRSLLLTCYYDKEFRSLGPAIEAVTDRLYQYFFREEKIFHHATLDFSGVSFDRDLLDLVFVNTLDDFGRALTIKDLKGTTIVEVSAARKLVDTFYSLENINIPQLEISDVNDSDLLLFNRYAFVIGSTEVLIAALRQAGSFDKLTSSGYFSFAGYSLAGITCVSLGDLREILAREGDLEGVTFPEEFHTWDLTTLFIDKNNLQILITQDFPLKNIDPKNRADVHGLQFRSFAQIQEAISLNMDVSQIDLAALEITESAQVELLINAKVALDNISLPANIGLQPHWQQALPFEILTLTQYQKFIAMARKNTEKSLPILPDELPRDKAIRLLTNTQTIMLHHWLQEVIKQDNFQDDFKKQLASSLTYFEPVAQTPVQLQLLESLLTQYYKTLKAYQISPAWIRQLKQLSREKHEEDRLSKTAHDRIHAILTQHRASMPKDNKFQDFVRDPSALANQLFFILVWMLDTAGYSTQDLLPPSFTNIGLTYLDLKDIDISDIYITKKDSSLVVYRVSELLKNLKNIKKFANPVNLNEEFSDEQVRLCLVEREDIRRELVRLHELALQESRKEKPSINPDVLTALETLGKDLTINSDNGPGGFNQRKANNQVITFHNFMKQYPDDKALLDTISFPLKARSHKLTNFTQLFTEAWSDGCTVLLSRSINEWVECFKESKAFSITYSPYTHYMDIRKSAETIALLSKQEKQPKFIIPEFYKNSQQALAPQCTFAAEVVARAKLDRLKRNVASSSFSTSNSRHSSVSANSSSTSTSSTFSGLLNAVNATGTSRSSKISRTISSTSTTHSTNAMSPVTPTVPPALPHSVLPQYPYSDFHDENNNLRYPSVQNTSPSYPLNHQDDDNEIQNTSIPLAYPPNNYYDNGIAPPSYAPNTDGPHPPNKVEDAPLPRYVPTATRSPSAANS